MSPARTTLMSHLLALFDLQHLQPGSATERTTSSSTDNNEDSITYGDLVRLLRTGPSRRDQDEEDDDVGNDDDEDSTSWNRQWYPPHTEPQKRGIELLTSGEFGRVGNKLRSRKCSRNISRLLLDRSCKPQGVLSREELSSVRSSSFSNLYYTYTALGAHTQFQRDCCRLQWRQPLCGAIFQR